MTNVKRGNIIFLLIAVVVTTVVVGCGNADVNNGNINNDNIDNPITDNENTNNEYDVITEEIVRNHKVTPASDFKYAEVAGGIEIRDYTGKDQIVVIPETIEGQKVVAISGYIFANDSTVRGIYIPSSITTLVATFPNNDDLEVVICEGVEKIVDQAFLNCKNLHTVILGKSLNELGERAFAGCKALTELYIAPSLININPSYSSMLFYKCENLTIKGQKDSYIENFCNEHGIPFVAV